MVVALVLLAVFIYAIYHLFKVLPTSFVPNEDQGYAMAAIIMPQAASLDAHAGDRRRGSDAIFKKIPGVADAHAWSPATACSTAASRPTPPRSS